MALWERFDQYINRIQNFVALGGYIGWAYTLWPKGAVFIGKPKDMNGMALLAIGVLFVGVVSTLSQLGVLRSSRRLKNDASTGEDQAPDWWRPFMPSANWTSYQYQQRWNQTYTKQTVELDGYDYINCTFDNVTFQYTGIAPFSLRNPTIIQEGPMVITTQNSVVGQTLAIAALFHQAKGGSAELAVRPK